MSNSLSNKSISGSLSVTGDTSVSGKVSVNSSSGDEGGEIFLNKPVTNTTLNSGVTIDVYQDKLRFFEQGGAGRGFYIDVATGGEGASTNLVSAGGGGGSYTLPEATDTTLGGVIVGDNLAVDANGVVSLSLDAGYSLLNSNADQTILGNKVVDGNLEVTGDLIVSGTTTTVSATNLEVTDPLIYLASDQYNTDAVDIGIYGAYGDAAAGHFHTGLIRDASDGVWKLVSGGPEPVDNVLDFAATNFDTLKVGALETTGNVTVGQNLSVTGSISGATGKNMTVASAYNGTSFTGTRVIMTATTPGAAAPTTRPDGTAIQAGDIWFS